MFEWERETSYLHGDNASWFEAVRRLWIFSVQGGELRVGVVGEASTLRDRQVLMCTDE